MTALAEKITDAHRSAHDRLDSTVRPSPGLLARVSILDHLVFIVDSARARAEQAGTAFTDEQVRHVLITERAEHVELAALHQARGRGAKAAVERDEVAVIDEFLPDTNAADTTSKED